MIKNIILIFALVLFSMQTYAEKEGVLNRFFAPGPLIKPHKHLEGNKCLSCHEKGKGVPNSKCLECHKEIQTSMKKKSSFHGTQKEDCIKCHTDHKGGDFNSVAFVSEKFDHSKTGFSLAPKHEKIKCIECHKEQRGSKSVNPKDTKFISAVTCKSCHKKDDIHFFKKEWAKKDCNSCHGVEGWKKDTRFDHKHDANYALNGKHSETKCKDCHNSNKDRPYLSVYKWKHFTQSNCLVCHTDPHRYSSASLKVINKNPTQCSICHDESGWKKIHNFSHNLDTRYPIDGAHKSLKCAQCHLEVNKLPIDKKMPGIYHWPKLNELTCENCHTNPHKKTFNQKFLNQKCTTCHTTEGWKVVEAKNDFNHSDTSFKLSGKHLTTTCTQCHVKDKKQVFKWTSTDKEFCIECHENVHKNQFSLKQSNRSCSDCHGTDNFKKRKVFDHENTGFTLNGAHNKLECGKCHTPTNQLFPFRLQTPMSKFHFPNLSQDKCTTCHVDTHKGKMGQSCSSCHEETNWKVQKNFHKNFTLSGTHLTLQCTECHVQNRKLTGLSQQCGYCHKKDDVHSGNLPECAKCHLQQFWENTKFRHSLTTFPLRGAHRTLQCQSCHANGVYQGLSTTCFSCHQKDAQTAGSLAHNPIGSFINCTNCHKNQFSFKSAN